MFIVKLKKSVIVTYFGIMFGILSMFFAITKMAIVESNDISYSLIFLILAGLCDMFDGKIARMCRRSEDEKNFGIQIDSLADTVNFVILPIIMMISLGMTSIIDVCVYILYAICGVSRLAVFNCSVNSDAPVKVYTGLPVTSVAIIYPILGLLYGTISNLAYEYLSISITFIVAVLFISKIKVPKFRKMAYVILPIIGLVVSIMLVVIKNVL